MDKIIKSGRRDSNPRRPAWEAGILATELLPLLAFRVINLITYLPSCKQTSAKTFASFIHTNARHV